MASGLKFHGISASSSDTGQPLAMRVKVWESQSSGLTLFILAVWRSVASVAHVRPPPSLPANRLFLRLCKSLHKRKNALFAGSDAGAEHWATIASLIETAKLNDVEPLAYLADVLSRIVNGHPNSQLNDLLPWAYAASTTPKAWLRAPLVRAES